MVVDDDSGRTGDLPQGESAECPNAGHRTINEAVQNASAGDTIEVCSGEYGPVTLDTGRLTIRANGSAEIAGSTGPAVRITAPEVTVDGFTITPGTTTNRTVEIGARGADVRNNTVEVRRVGIFLSDGHAEGGDVGSGLQAAPDSRIRNNTITVNATVGLQETVYGIWSDADHTDIRKNTVIGSGYTTSILSSGNETDVTGNTIRYPDRRIQGAAIRVGLSTAGHDWAVRNRVADNDVSGGPDRGILVGTLPRNVTIARATVVRTNTVVDSASNEVTDPGGITAYANETVVRNNTVVDSGHDDLSRGFPGKSVDGIRVEGYRIHVIGNTVRRNEDGVTLSVSTATVEGNVIQNNELDGVFVGIGNITGLIANNTITGNAAAGIRIQQSPGVAVEAHYNHIRNNGGLGIHNHNYIPTDGKWPVMNATLNYWGCGGPSGGLRDPVTDRIANGSGEALSAGDDPGYSNVHFDPFLERSSCPSLSGTPTSTPTSTPTPTPTSTPTSSPTRQAPGGDDGGDDGDGDGDGTGTADGGGGTADGPGGGSGDQDTGGSGGDTTGDTSGGESTPPPQPPTPTATVPPTATESPTPTQSPTSTNTPTPRTEPGFGVVAWFLGTVVLVWLLARRRRHG